MADRMAGVVPNAIGDLLRHGADPSVISFAGGMVIEDLEWVLALTPRQEPNHARVNFSGASDEGIREGVRRLGALLREPLPG